MGGWRFAKDKTRGPLAMWACGKRIDRLSVW